jgi:hypothetical protein
LRISMRVSEARALKDSWSRVILRWYTTFDMEPSHIRALARTLSKW